MPTNVTHVHEPRHVLLHKGDHRRLRRIAADRIETIGAELRAKHPAYCCALLGRREDDHCRGALLLGIDE